MVLNKIDNLVKQEVHLAGTDKWFHVLHRNMFIVLNLLLYIPYSAVLNAKLGKMYLLYYYMREFIPMIVILICSN